MKKLLVVLLLTVLAACAAPDPIPSESFEVPPPPTPGEACAEVTEPPDAPVLAFFHCAGAELEPPRPVARRAQAAEPVSRLEGALIGLIGGPTEAEAEAGFISFFTRDTALSLRSVEIGPDGVAFVDFGDFRGPLSSASTSTGSQVLLAQLNATVFQVPEVTSVEYQINGSCPAFWEWLQRGCARITRSEWGG